MDVAKLVFDFDATSATAAERQIDKLVAANDRLEMSAGKASKALASGALDQGRAAAVAYERAFDGLSGAINQTRDALGRFTNVDGAFRLSQEETAKMTLQNARAVNALEKEQDQAARTVQRLTAAYDPLGAEILKTNALLADAEKQYARGRLTADEYGTVTTGLSGKLANLQKAHGGAAEAAKLQSYQLLNLGRQGADVFVSLASGQALWMVAIQQGAQIGEVFAEAKTQGVSLKSAFSELAGGATRALFSPGGLFAVGALAVGGLALAFAKGSKEAAQFRNQLTITGNAAGLTAGQFEDMAHRIADANDTSFADTKKLISQAAASGKLSGDTLALAVQNAQTFSKYTGESASKYLAEYEKMRGGVAKFAAEHALVYHDLTLQQIKQIEALEKANKAREAEQRLMEDIAATMQQRAAPAYGWLEKATINVTNRAKDMWDAILGVGREKTVDQKLADAQANLAKVQDPNSTQNSALKRRPDGQYTYGAAAAASAQQDILRARMDVSFFQMLKTNQEKNAAKASRDAQGESDRIQGWLDSRNKSTPRDMAAERSSQLDAALAQAKASELQARQAMVKDLETRAQLERDIIKAEAEVRAAEIAKTVAGIQDDKGLSSAKKAELTAGWDAVKKTEERVAAIKTQAVDERLFSDQLARRRAVEDTIAGYTDRQAQSQAALATSLEHAQAIENAAIAARQQREADRRDFDLFMDWADGKKTQAEVQQIQSGAQAADAAEREVKARNDRLAIFDRDLQIARARSQNAIAILDAEKGYARSSYQAALTDSRIEQAQYDARRDELARIIANTDINGKEHDTAVDDLATLNRIHEIHKKQENLALELVASYAGAIDAVSGMARSVIDGDVGGSITGLSNSLNKVSGLFSDPSKGLGKLLGQAGDFLGPVGQAVSAVTGVLGAIGQKSAEAAQRKLDALNKGVEDLRASNMASSGSIKGALDEANKLYNSDLEYSSSMLASLRSIDTQIGALSNSLSRSITAGNLLSTSGLGLGTTGLILPRFSGHPC